MDIFTTTPDQIQILESRNSLMNVNYIDKEIAIETIALQIRQAILSKHTALIVIPDKSARQTLEKVLKNISLNQLVLSVTLDESPSPNDFQIIKHTHLPAKLSPYIRESDTLSYQMKVREIDDLIKAREVIITKGLNWRQAVDSFCKLGVSQDVLLLNRMLDPTKFDMSDEGQNQINAIVTTALSYYHPEFEIKDHSLLNHEFNKNITDHEQLKTTVQDMIGLLNDSEDLKYQYLDYNKEIENNFLQNSFQNIHKFKTEAEHFKLKISQYLSEQNQLSKSLIPGFLSEKQKIHTQQGKDLLNQIQILFKEVEDLTHVCIPTANKIILSLVQSCAEIPNILDRYQAEIITKKAEYIKSVNVHNHLDNKLIALENNFRELITKINQAGFLKEKLEINTLSFSKQTDQIIGLTQKLSLLLKEAEQNMYYLEWNQFFSKKSEQEQNILQALRGIDPANWLNVIEGWFLYYHITKEFVHLHSLSNHKLDDLAESCIRVEHNMTQDAIYDLYVQIPEKLKTLKKTNSNLYKIFTSNTDSLHGNTWDHILDNHYEYIKDFFPIIITDSDKLTRLKHSDKRELIVFNHKDTNVDIMQLFRKITYYWSENQAVINPEYEMLTSINTEDFRSVKVSERLPLFRNIAHNLLSIPVTPQIYLIKDACILSYASAFLTEKITTSLYHHGIKKVVPEPSIAQALTGAFLESPNAIYCIIEDDLFNPSSTQDILWQYRLINILKQMGITLVSLSSNTLFNNEYQIDELIESIAIQQSHYNRQDKIQMTIEFN